MEANELSDRDKILFQETFELFIDTFSWKIIDHDNIWHQSRHTKSSKHRSDSIHSSPRRAEHYQSGRCNWKKELIAQLQSQAYEYLKITKEDDLTANLRVQLEKLNNYTFSDSEWKQFFDKPDSKYQSRYPRKTTTIQEDYIKILKRDDESEKHLFAG